MLSEAVADTVHRKRLRPEVMAHLEDSMDDSEELGRLLATDVFLRLNGWRLVLGGAVALAFLVGVLEFGQVDLEPLPPWIQNTLQKS